PKDWLRLKLTGAIATEPADASTTLLYDVMRGDWAYPFVDALGLSRDLLPPLIASGENAGGLLPAAAGELGLPVSVPVAAGLADAAACLLGIGQTRPGDTVLQIGSGMQIMAVVETAKPELQPFYNTFRGFGPLLFKMAAMQNGGTAFEWARQALAAEWT